MEEWGRHDRQCSVYNEAMRHAALFFFVLATCVAGCNKPQANQQPASPKSGRVVLSGTVLSITVAPGSAFKMAVSFDPPQPVMSKKTTFHLTVTDLSGAPVNDAKVQGSLVMPLMDMGKSEFTLQPTGGGVYQGTSQFTMSGEWEAIFTAAADGRSGKTTFNVRVED